MDDKKNDTMDQKQTTTTDADKTHLVEPEPATESHEVDDVKETNDKTSPHDGNVENLSQDEKLGKVIPFNPQAPIQTPIQDINQTLETASVALTDTISSFKVAFADLKKQIAPLADGFREITTALNEGLQSIQSTSNENHATQTAATHDTSDTSDTSDVKSEDSEHSESNDASQSASNREDKTLENATASAAKEASQLLEAGFKTIKERTSNIHFNLKDAIKQEFDEYVDKHLDTTQCPVDADGNRVVRVDGDFMANHASEVVPALVRGTVGSFLKAILGTDPIKDAVERTENADKTDQDSTDVKEESKEPGKYRVEFDFANAISNAIRNAQTVQPAQTQAEIESREQGRELLIESSRILEDSLNGKTPENSKERLEDAIKRASAEDADKAPKDIQAVDEKHQKILDLTRGFEKDLT